MPRKRPTREELESARDKTVPELIAPGLEMLFCGINPSLYSAATGYHFARPGNRFWPALYAAGLTHRLLLPEEGRELLKRGLGITNMVQRATTAADELTPAEFQTGGERLINTLRRYRPKRLAVLGIGAYRQAFGRSKAAMGLQPEKLEGTEVWVLPNPSGLNAHFQLPELARLFKQPLHGL